MSSRLKRILVAGTGLALWAAACRQPQPSAEARSLGAAANLPSPPPERVRSAAQLDAESPRPASSPAPPRPRVWLPQTRVFWIGGAADKAPFFGIGPHHHVLWVMQYWQRTLPGEHSYWGYHELDELTQALRDCRRQHPDAAIVLIGHSFGGATALRAARTVQADVRPVELIITLDAVWPLSVAAPARKGCWVNVHPPLNVSDALANVPLVGPALAGVMSLLAADSGSNTVATVGRQLGPHPLADVDVEGPFEHGQASDMLRAALEAYAAFSGEPVPDGE